MRFMTDERTAVCALNRIFGYHPVLGRELIEACGGAAPVFEGPRPEVPGHPELAEEIGPEALEWAQKELERVQADGFRFLTYQDEDYPAPLLECSDPPLGLYLNGSTSAAEIFGLRPMIGVVGTRDISSYGREWCQKLVEAMAAAPIQPVIVSGMAFGTDGIAHQTALDTGLPTVGVMPTGIDKVYPWRHEGLAMSIVRTPGCGLVTDYPLGSAPLALNFLRRNRIIAGLVSAVIVVESKNKGGALMTAKYANGYSRDVYAVPGRLDDVRSAGCNSLIGTGMAQIVTSAEELVGQLGLGKPVRGRGGSWGHGGTLQEALAHRFGAESPLIAVVLAIRENRGITVEQLSALLGRPFPEVLSAVMQLEAQDVVSTDLLRRCSLTPTWS